MSELKFMQACLQGDALLEDIEDYIDQWHESDSDEEIYDYLGMTKDEYFVYVDDESLLKTIFQARDQNIPINDFLENYSDQMMAARAQSPEEAAALKAWYTKREKFRQGE